MSVLRCLPRAVVSSLVTSEREELEEGLRRYGNVQRILVDGFQFLLKARVLVDYARMSDALPEETPAVSTQLNCFCVFFPETVTPDNDK